MALIKNARAESLPRKAMVLDLGDLQRHAEALAGEAERRARATIEEASKERARLITGATEEGRRLGQEKGLAQGLAEGREKGKEEAIAQTRAAAESIVKSWEAALTRLEQAGLLKRHPLTAHCAAVSVGVVGGEPALDLPYVEDSTAEVDMNVVMTGAGAFVEVQGTAEQTPFAKARLDELLALAGEGIARLIGLQRRALEARGEKRFTL